MIEPHCSWKVHYVEANDDVIDEWSQSFFIFKLAQEAMSSFSDVSNLFGTQLSQQFLISHVNS